VVDQLWDIINPALIIQNKSIEPFENQQLRNTVPTASYQSDKLNLDDTQKKLLRVFRSTEFDLQEASFSDLVFKHGLNPSFGYKDVQIAPDDPQIIKIERNEILPIIQDCRVKLVNFGGLDFPFESLSGARETRLKNAIQCLDMSPLPFFTTSFNFWQMNDGLYFASRSLMPENFYTNSLNETPLINTLNYSWVLMDIVRPLIFAHNILNKEKSLRSLMFQYVWSGLLHRSLIMSMPSRMGFIRDYRCKGENEWKYKLFIKRETNLLDEALKACINLFWLFGWEPDQSVTQTIRHDLQMFLNGVFPE
jgi:hypothetical protein